MKKFEFLLQLHEKLRGLPHDDLEERLAFYNEMIDDRMEDGLSEEEAISQIGSVDEIAAQIIADTPLSKLVKEKIKPKKRHKTWEIVLLAVGSPLWLSLLTAAFAVGLSLYASLWAVIVSFWAVFVSMGACALGGLMAGIVLIPEGHSLPGLAMIAAAIVCAGLTVFLFCGCKAATKGTVWITGKITLGIKRCFMKKEAKSWIKH